MGGELARAAWILAPLDASEAGPYGGFPRLGDAQKRGLWDAWRKGSAPRAPVALATNNRVVLLDPRFNPERTGYREVFSDPAAMLAAQLRWQYVIRMRHHVFSDQDTDLPETWRVAPHFQNCFEAASFGCPLVYRDGELPDTEPAYRGERKEAVFETDIERPLENPFLRSTVEMTLRMRALARGSTFLGRPIEVDPYLPTGTDGPLTVSMNLRGPEILTDLADDPGYAGRLFDFVVRAAVLRGRAFRQYWGLPEDPDAAVPLADDSIALLGSEQYVRQVLPSHRLWFRERDPEGRRRRAIHLCGDAQRHFPVIRRELGVTAFDTGFPIDFRRLREELGPGTEITGGVEVGLLLGASPAAVYGRAREILSSGILRGGRFSLHEANNLPPGAPWPNLAAMYKASFDARAEG